MMHPASGTSAYSRANDLAADIAAAYDVGEGMLPELVGDAIATDCWTAVSRVEVDTKPSQICGLIQAIVNQRARNNC